MKPSFRDGPRGRARNPGAVNCRQAVDTHIRNAGVHGFRVRFCAAPRNDDVARSRRRMSDIATIDAPGTGEADDPAGRPRVVLSPAGHRRAEGGHPWIYSNELVIDPAAKALAPGSLVTLHRADRRPFGVAMFNPHTLIAARLLDRDAARAINKRF